MALRRSTRPLSSSCTILSALRGGREPPACSSCPKASRLVLLLGIQTTATLHRGRGSEVGVLISPSSCVFVISACASHSVNASHERLDCMQHM